MKTLNKLDLKILNFNDKKIKIATHNGIYHADEVLALAMLKVMFGDVFDFQRTRDPEIIKNSDIVLDVGGIYDPQNFRFDHHQGKVGARASGVPYATAGLVWKEFGLKWLTDAVGMSPVSAQTVYDQVDYKLVSPVDCKDTGYQPLLVKGDKFNFWSAEERFEKVGLKTGKHPASGLDFTQIISNFNRQEGLDEGNESYDLSFEQAVSFAVVIFHRVVQLEVHKIDSQEVVKKLLESREDKYILVLEHFVHWQEACCQDLDLLYVVFREKDGNNWMVQAVPEHPGSFVPRKKFPQEWTNGDKAKTPQELDKVTGARPGAVFCHIGRFIAGHSTKEGAIEMARTAVSRF